MAVIISSVLLFFLFIPLLDQSYVSGRELSGIHTRTIAREWILANIPVESKLLIEQNGPLLPTRQYEYFIVDDQGELFAISEPDDRYANYIPPYTQIGDLDDENDVREKGVEYMILSNFYDIYLQEQTAIPIYAQDVDRYESLMDMAEKLYEINAIPGQNSGPRIRVYRFEWTMN